MKARIIDPTYINISRYEKNLETIKIFNSLNGDAKNTYDALVNISGVQQHQTAILAEVNRCCDIIREANSEMEKVISAGTSAIGHNRAIIMKSNTADTVSKKQITDYELQTREITTKINEVNNQQRTLLQEQNTLNQTKASLVNNMNPKQKAFILQKAVETNDQEISELFINTDFNPNFQNAARESLLHTAVKYNHQQLLQKVISKNPNLNIKDANGNTAFHIALEQSKLELAKLLIKNESAGEELIDAIYQNKLIIVKNLLAIKPSLIQHTDSQGEQVLKIALEQTREEIANALISAGATIPTNNITVDQSVEQLTGGISLHLELSGSANDLFGENN